MNNLHFLAANSLETALAESSEGLDADDLGTYVGLPLGPVETDAAVCESLLAVGVPDAVELAAWDPAALYPRSVDEEA